ncbi:MAG: hypothetical protein KDA91_16540 [Planctomycetaceae bacterium]|nr:hypothetical protein [Planctomycetaceae bacterium]
MSLLIGSNESDKSNTGIFSCFGAQQVRMPVNSSQRPGADQLQTLPASVADDANHRRDNHRRDNPRDVGITQQRTAGLMADD